MKKRIYNLYRPQKVRKTDIGEAGFPLMIDNIIEKKENIIIKTGKKVLTRERRGGKIAKSSAVRSTREKKKRNK